MNLFDDLYGAFFAVLKTFFGTSYWIGKIKQGVQWFYEKFKD